MSDLLQSKFAVKKPGWVDDFKAFIMRGNVVDLAVGVVIGVAFTGIVNSLVKDIITPSHRPDHRRRGLLKPLYHPQRPIRADLGRRRKSRLGDHQLRRVPERGPQLPDRGGRDFLDGPAHPENSKTPAARRGSDAPDGSSFGRNPRYSEGATERVRIRKRFFFEKKNQKTSFTLKGCVWRGRRPLHRPSQKVFLLLFVHKKKSFLTFLSLPYPSAGAN